MIIDSHMHINRKMLEDEAKYINAINNNPHIEKVINVGLDMETAKETLNIANSNAKFFSSVGIHPLYIDMVPLKALDSLYALASNPKVVAIGEIGLDNTNSHFEKQKEYLIRQIIIANNMHLPVIIHANNTNELVMEIFARYVKPKYGCVFHCFQPDLESLKYLINNGFYISFAGRLTYKNAKKSLEVAKTVPDDLFLVETDSPYIAPEPLREEVNETANIKYIIDKLAEVRQCSYGEIERITNENAKRLFRKMK